MKTIKLTFVLWVIFLLVIPGRVHASHSIGAYISYQYQGPNQYLLTFKFHRDCNGITAPATADLCYQSASAGLSGAITLTPVPGTGNEIPSTPCVVPGLTTCQGGFIYGMQEWVYEGVVTLPQAAADWVFTWEECCRNANITTIQNAAGLGYYVFATLDNLNYPVNNSPQFTTSSYAQYCVNSLSTYSLPCTDIDGDSLVYSLVSAEDAFSGCPNTPFTLTYYAPYSATNPVSSSTPILFDPLSGIMTFTPDFIQTGVICLLVSEYRNGVLIGEVKRDELIFINNGILNLNYLVGKVFFDQNGNSMYDPGEPGKPGTILEVQPGIFYASANSYGNYTIPLNAGNYTVTIPNLPPFFMSTPSVNSASFPGSLQVDSLNDFALTMIPNIQNLKVTLTGNNAVPGSSPQMYLTYKNEGSIPMSGSVSLVYDSDLVFDFATITPDNISGDTLTWLFSNLNSLDVQNIYIAFSLPASVPLGTPLNSYAEILPVAGDTIPADNFYAIYREVVTSCDPNEKKVTPEGPVTTAQIASGEYLEFTIFFQNTGTAPAINIIITDTLDQNFNIPSFEVLSASHPYSWNISGQGIIEFTFNNIMLPDSGTNQMLSHGFIKYRIKPKSNLTAGDKMTNIAYIVFDSNAPLATNFTSTTVINPVSVNQVSAGNPGVVIYPNPANNFLNIEMNLKDASSCVIQFFNIVGETVKKITYNRQAGYFKKQASLDDLSAGIYFLKLTSSNGVSIVKIVKK